MVMDARDRAVSMPKPISYAEGRVMVDREARRVLGIGVDEFLARYDAGEIPWGDHDNPMHGELVSLVMLIPFARPGERRATG
jgi:hypothetical protein